VNVKVGVEQSGGKPGLFEKIVSWRPLRGHYEKFEREAVALNPEDLVRKRAHYNHLERNTYVITGLELAATVGGVLLVGPHVHPIALGLAVGPVALGGCLLGPTRGIVRMSERGILDEVIAQRGISIGGTPSSLAET